MFSGRAYDCRSKLGQRVTATARRTRAQPFLAGCRHRSPQPENRSVFLVLHSPICGSPQRPRIRPVCRLGHNFCGPEYFRRPDCHHAGRPTGRAHTFLSDLPAPSAQGDRFHHDWIGNLSGGQRLTLKATRSDDPGSHCEYARKADLATPARSDPRSRSRRFPVPATSCWGKEDC